jgi:hypothetical protein
MAAELRQVPENMSREKLVALLDDIRARVASGDSMEGSFEYLLPEQVGADPDSYDVTARYRTGNAAGQGGMRVIGNFA